MTLDYQRSHFVESLRYFTPSTWHRKALIATVHILPARQNLESCIYPLKLICGSIRIDVLE